MLCQICGSNTNTVIQDTLRKGEKRKVFFCSKCDLGILEGVPSAKELKKFYDKAYRSTAVPVLDHSGSDPKELFSIYERFQKERIERIRPFVNKKSILLEIGCSAGMFLYHAKKIAGTIIGIDYDSRAANFAAKKCHCKTYAGDLASTDIKKGSIDVICMFQTLEHIKDPASFLRQVSEYLKPGGVIYIEVPNLYDALRAAYQLPYYNQFYFHSAHYWYFSQKSLLKVAALAGFKGSVKFSQDYNLLNHMSWVTRDLPQQSCIPGLSEPELPLRKTLSTKSKIALQSFIKKINKEYKDILVKQGLSANLAYIGRKNKS